MPRLTNRTNEHAAPQAAGSITASNSTGPVTPFSPFHPGVRLNVDDLQNLLGGAKKHINEINLHSDNAGSPTLVDLHEEIKGISVELEHIKGVQHTDLDEIKFGVRNRLKREIVGDLSEQISRQIFHEIEIQVRGELNQENIDGALAQSFRSMFVENDGLLRDAQNKLLNSKARRENSAYDEIHNFNDQLQIVCNYEGRLPDGDVLFPKTLMELFSLSDLRLEHLLQFYDLRDCGNKIDNLNRFLAFIGLTFSIPEQPASWHGGDEKPAQVFMSSVGSSAAEKVEPAENKLAQKVKGLELKKAHEQAIAEQVRRAEEKERADELKRVEAEELKRVEEVKRAEEARRADGSRRAQDVKRAEGVKKAEDARRAEDLRREAETKRVEQDKRVNEARIMEEANRVEEEKKAEEADRIREAKRIEALQRSEEAKRREEAEKVRVHEEMKAAAAQQPLASRNPANPPGQEQDHTGDEIPLGNIQRSRGSLGQRLNQSAQIINTEANSPGRLSVSQTHLLEVHQTPNPHIPPPPSRANPNGQDTNLRRQSSDQFASATRNPSIGPGNQQSVKGRWPPSEAEKGVASNPKPVEEKGFASTLKFW